ncbi:MAG: hypothetical protein ABWX65_13135 [Mycetocola sp.]
MTHPVTDDEPDDYGVDDDELEVLPDDLIDDDLDIGLDDERPLDEVDIEPEGDLIPEDE